MPWIAQRWLSRRPAGASPPVFTPEGRTTGAKLQTCRIRDLEMLAYSTGSLIEWGGLRPRSVEAIMAEFEIGWLVRERGTENAEALMVRLRRPVEPSDLGIRFIGLGRDGQRLGRDAGVQMMVLVGGKTYAVRSEFWAFLRVSHHLAARRVFNETGMSQAQIKRMMSDRRRQRRPAAIPPEDMAALESL